MAVPKVTACRPKQPSKPNSEKLQWMEEFNAHLTDHHVYHHKMHLMKEDWVWRLHVSEDNSYRSTFWVAKEETPRSEINDRTPPLRSGFQTTPAEISHKIWVQDVPGFQQRSSDSCPTRWWIPPPHLPAGQNLAHDVWSEVPAPGRKWVCLGVASWSVVASDAQWPGLSSRQP